VIKRIKAEGWMLVRVKGLASTFQTRRAHWDRDRAAPEKDFPIGTLKSIERQSGAKLT